MFLVRPIHLLLGELIVYVHGIWASESDAQEQTDRVFLSLDKERYHFPLIGFSWDSNTAFSLDDLSISKHGWEVAKNIANKNGPLLGKFILNKNKCPNDKVRLIALSLGSRVTLSAVQWVCDNGNIIYMVLQQLLGRQSSYLIQPYS